ncbi:hypothetical protein PQX77_019817 [Marasmius sp. AFHP31]|nr:hypothetical protein PQX77_019817 [Marasmius sp. AFHP31]
MLCAECKGKIDKPIHRWSMENAPGVWIKLTPSQIASTIHSTSSLITGCRWCSSDSEAVNMTRKECVKKETGRWLALVDRLLKQEAKLRSKEFEAKPCLKKREGTGEEFGLDCHDTSLENVFVDEQDPTKIPTFQLSSSQTHSRRNFFREVLVKIAADVSAQTSSSNGIKSQSSGSPPSDFGTLAHEWFHYETAGMRLRMAHRFVEWGKAWQRDAWLRRVRRRLVEGVEHNADSAL